MVLKKINLKTPRPCSTKKGKLSCSVTLCNKKKVTVNTCIMQVPQMLHHRLSQIPNKEYIYINIYTYLTMKL